MTNRNPFPDVPPPPAAELRPETRVVHGVELVDPYGWLRAENWQEVLRDPRTLPGGIRTVLEEENRYADRVLAPVADLQTTLRAEMRGRIKEDDSEVPVPDGPYRYFTRHREGGEHPIVGREPREGGAEEIVLDGDGLAAGKPFFDIADASHSPDHRLLAWGVDERGSELHTIRVRDIASGQDRDDLVTDTDGTAVWAADNSGFFYVKVDDNHRACAVLFHRLGTGGADILVLEEHDPGWFLSIEATKSKRFCLVSLHNHDSAEVHLVDLAAPLSGARLVAPREPGQRYEVEHRGDTLFILTNRGGAEDFKIVTAPVSSPSPDHWADLVPHRPGRMIIALTVAGDHLVRLEREDGLPRIVIRRLADGAEREIAFPEEAYSLSLLHLAEADVATIRTKYSSLTTPDEISDHDLLTGERTLRKRRVIPSGFDPALYVARRIFAPAPDGALVPVSILHRRDTAIDGTAPLLLYAYGAYGHATPASFGSNRFSLVDRGFVFAIAHVRGGTDKGWAWYENGRLGNKTNTFTDFIAAAEHLIREGYTGEKRIVGQGGSAGGMLIGAVANRAPHLFAGLIADVPFVDVLNTMLDADLPLTPPEWLEWGNPITDPGVFEAMRAYSPYDTVSAQSYPPILALAGLTDPRVTYWEPAKWVARLRATMTGGGPILLKTNMEAGHGGASGRFDQLKEVALEYAFALMCVGKG